MQFAQIFLTNLVSAEQLHNVRFKTTVAADQVSRPTRRRFSRLLATLAELEKFLHRLVIRYMSRYYLNVLIGNIAIRTSCPPFDNKFLA